MVKVNTERLQMAVTGLTQAASESEIQKHIEHVINAVVDLASHRRKSLTIKRSLVSGLARAAHRIDALHLADENKALDVQCIIELDKLDEFLVWSSREGLVILETEQETRQ